MTRKTKLAAWGTGVLRGRTDARRVFQAILSAEWAIRPEWLHQFAGVAQRMGEDGDPSLTAAEVRSEIRRALAALREGDGEPTSLALDYGEPLNHESRVTVRDGVAIVPVIGPLYHYADSLHDVCGCSSYSQLARDIAAIRANRDQVGKAVFEFDSPGGVVGGVSEAAELVAGLAREMPALAYVTDLGCSAAYWLASAAGEVVLAPTAMVGSIGVVAAYRVRKDGSDMIEIVSSQSPKKRPDVQTKEGLAQIQATLDALAGVFIQAVAKYRGVSAETVVSEFGGGDVFVGAHAVEAGLADRVATFEDVLAELAARPAPFRGTPAGGGSALTQEEVDVTTQENATPAADNKPAEVTAASVAADHPAVADALRAEGATAERERILGIQALAIDGAEAVISECVADSSCTVERAAFKVLEWQKQARASESDQRKDALKQLEAAEEGLDAPSSSTQAPEAGSDEAVAARILSIHRPQRAAQ